MEDGCNGRDDCGSNRRIREPRQRGELRQCAAIRRIWRHIAAVRAGDLGRFAIWADSGVNAALVGVDGFDLAAVARPESVEGAFGIHPLVGVGPEEVPLALHECSGQPVGPEAVVVRQR